MTSPQNSTSYKSSPWEKFTICLPHPYLTRYYAQPEEKGPNYRIIPASGSSKKEQQTFPPFPLHNLTLSLRSLEKGHYIPDTDNTGWARARRSPSTTFSWGTTNAPPTLAQLWLLVYSIFTVYHTEETIRLRLVGAEVLLLREELVAVGLAIRHPLPVDASPSSESWNQEPGHEIVLLRSSFWQGAGSPFGPRSVWLPPAPDNTRQPLSSFPPFPTTHTITTKFPSARVHTLHPIRPVKPLPGSVIYSRYIPHLDENFSMTAFNYKDPAHLHLFHTWQNDPRVAAGWNETGSLEQHRAYLKNLHDDAHVLTMLVSFDDTHFAYFEVYWAKEDHLGAHYVAGDWDRGRYSLVGNTAFRGPHRAHAWWSSLMHYIFLDEPRTECVVGEPKNTNTRVLELDSLHGFHVERFVDLPHKRSVFVRCSRERYFGLCTVGLPYLRGVEKTSKL